MTKEEVKAIRKSLNFSQGELAEKLGVGIKTIIKYEKGSVIPDSKIVVINKLSKLFKINPKKITISILKLNAQVDLLNYILESDGHVTRRRVERLRTKKIEEIQTIISSTMH